MADVFDAITDRDDAGALMPEDAAREVIAALPEASVVISEFNRVPVSQKQKRIPAMAAFPYAYMVGGDTGLKQTTFSKWDNRYVNIEEMAVLLPIPDAVIDDARSGGYDLWGTLRPYLVEAIGRKADELVFFGGSDAPDAWPDAIYDACVAKSKTYALGTADANEGGVAEDVNQLLALVEDCGYAPGVLYADRKFRSRIRGARATDGQKLLDVTQNTIEDIPVRYRMRGLWPAGTHMFAVDPEEFVVGIRSDISLQMFDSGVVSDDDGKVLLNLIQQDSKLMRVTFRLGWTNANTLQHDNVGDEDAYGASVLITETASPS